MLYYINGVLQASITPNQTTPTLILTVPSIPAGGNVTLVFEVDVNEYAPLDVSDEITNEGRTARAVGDQRHGDHLHGRYPAACHHEEHLAGSGHRQPDRDLHLHPGELRQYGVDGRGLHGYLRSCSQQCYGNQRRYPDDAHHGLHLRYRYRQLTILSGHLTVPAATYNQDAGGVVT